MIRHFRVWLCGAMTEDLWRPIRSFVSVSWEKEIINIVPSSGLDQMSCEYFKITVLENGFHFCQHNVFYYSKYLAHSDCFNSPDNSS